MPRKPAQPCTTPGCPELKPCAEHPVKAWQRSTPRATALSGSAQQKRAARIIARDHGICHVCHQPGADRADHIIALALGGQDNETNMAPIHTTPCDTQKIANESRSKRWGTPTTQKPLGDREGLSAFTVSEWDGGGLRHRED